ncbi:RES family NAD+ phosphorylase [Candidatus Poriferisodalis sp.]|uniref:RES family NAD+ phosphorylase n=1 Tax=Candidatus Poriferisodalis sp. TaxID=3101277 RepID=UPI003AF88064
MDGFRNQTPGFPPTSGKGALLKGGRYNPPGSFPTVYLCSTRACTVAELTRSATQQGLRIADMLPRELWEISTVEPVVLLDLTDPATLRHLSLTHSNLARDDLQTTQQIGQAAFDTECQAIRGPSATGIDIVYAVFPEKLQSALQATLIETWTAPAQL